MRRKRQDGPVPLTDEMETAMKEDGMDIEPNEGTEIARRLAKQWLHEGTELIPLSHLGLDHPEPVGGWEPLLQARGIELLEDDLLRPSVARTPAGWRRSAGSGNLRAPRRLANSASHSRVRPSPPVSRPSSTARRWSRSWPTIPAT